MSVEWPKKKNCPVKYKETREFKNGYDHGFDACHDAFMKVIVSQPELIPLDSWQHVCQVMRDAVTIKWNTKSLEIPNCVFNWAAQAVIETFGQSKEKLVPFDSIKLKFMASKHFKTEFILGQNHEEFDVTKFIHEICETYGIPPQREEVTVEEMAKVGYEQYMKNTNFEGKWEINLSEVGKDHWRLIAQAILDRIGGK